MPEPCAASPPSSQHGDPRLQALGKTISADRVTFDEYQTWVALTDGRTLGIPFAWFPYFLAAPPFERQAVTLSAFGLHWDALEEDILIAGLLAGRGDMAVIEL